MSAIRLADQSTFSAVQPPLTNDGPTSHLQIYSQICGITTLTLGVLVLYGWAFNVPFLTSIIPGRGTTKVNTAMCLVLASMSLWLLTPVYSARFRTTVARLFAGVVFLISATTLIEDVFKENLGIDRIWRTHNMASFGISAAGRPAPTTAIALTAVSIALLLLGSEKRLSHMIAQMISMVPALIGLMAFNGYIYHADLPYRLFLYNQMAMPTAAGLLILSSGTFFARRSGIAQDLIGPTPGGFMARRFLPAVFIIPILVGWASLHLQVAGMYGPAFIPALNATLNTTAFAVLIWASARRVDRQYRICREAQNEIRRLNVDLEDRVAERTVTLKQQAKLLTEQAALLDLAQDAIIVLDLEHRITFWSHGAEEIYGWADKEAIGQPLHKFLQAQFSEPPNVGRAKLSPEKKSEGEEIHKKHDGTSIVVASRWTTQYDAEGVPVRILVINSDITAKKRALEVLRENEENLRLLFQGVKDYEILSLDPVGRITSWNEGGQRINGYSAGEIIGRHFSIFYTPEAVAAGQPSAELQIANKDGRFEEEGWRVRKDGGRFWANVIITALRDDTGRLRGFAKVTRDITARKNAESEHLLLTERLSLATSIAKVGVWEWDLASDTLVWDATMFEIYAIPPTVGMTYKKWAATVDVRDLPTVEANLRTAIASKGHGVSEFRIIRPNGVVRNVSSVERVYLDEHGNVSRVVGVNVDVTDRKSAEAAREESRKSQLRFKDDFLSQVSHELRSPLTAIKQFTTILLDGLAGELNDDQHKYEQIVLRNTVQMQSMIDDLLEVTRLESGKLSVEPECMLAAEAITDVFNTFRGTALERGIDLSVDLPPGLPQVYADPTRLRQILIVLVDNAIKFTPSGGRVKIRARRNESEADSLILEVSDTGKGIDPETTTKIFGRLFQASSTSDAGRKGLGLGLFICKELVTRQGGNIWVKSELEKGSTFSFTLPIFLLKKMLAPLRKNEQWPSKYLALLTVEIGVPVSRSSGEAREQWSLEARRAVQLCLLPDLDLLFPQMKSNAQKEQMFVAAFTDKKGASALAAKVRDQLHRLVSPEEAGLSVSFAMLHPPLAEANATADNIVSGMAAYFEESIQSNTVMREIHYA